MITIVIIIFAIIILRIIAKIIHDVTRAELTDYMIKLTELAYRSAEINCRIMIVKSKYWGRLPTYDFWNIDTKVTREMLSLESLEVVISILEDERKKEKERE